MKTTISADRVGKAGAQQNDIFTRVTNVIIERLQQGEIPWKKPWGSSELWPRNYASNRKYKGFNALILAFAFGKPYYMTFKQAKELGGHVKKGSESLPVVYYELVRRLKSTGAKISEIEAL
jgi:antirestriction protein ArdC